MAIVPKSVRKHKKKKKAEDAAKALRELEKIVALKKEGRRAKLLNETKDDMERALKLRKFNDRQKAKKPAKKRMI
jgi:hypothetical protein